MDEHKVFMKCAWRLMPFILLLYFINYAIAGMIVDLSGAEREWPSIVLHIIFGIVCAEAYKGFVRRRPLAPLM